MIPIFTTDPTTDVGKIRVITGDKYEEAAFHDDEEIQVFLDLYDDDLKLAAAAVLDSMASNEAVIQKQIKLLDLSTNGPAVAKALREHAAELRRQVDEEPAFDVAEQVFDMFGAREKILKDALRDG
ncbi:MAG: hypothetical protein FH756_01555 [Firmicutes bacterium]|nr:hypothetical protein [Bacillota bacterium]